MLRRLLSRTLFSTAVMGAVLTLMSSQADAFFRWRGGWGGGGGGGGSTGGSVPEIGMGSAAAAVALLVGGAYLLKDRFSRTKGSKTGE